MRASEPLEDNLLLLLSSVSEGRSQEFHERESSVAVHLRDDGLIRNARGYRISALIQDSALPAGLSELVIYGFSGGRNVVRELAAALRGVGAESGLQWHCMLLPGQARTDLAEHLYLTFSWRPDDVGEEYYESWYAMHLEENLRMPGFARGWRYRVSSLADGLEGYASVYWHLAMYEIHGEMSVLRRVMKDAAEVNSASWPEWFERRRKIPFEAQAVGWRVV